MSKEEKQFENYMFKSDFITELSRRTGLSGREAERATNTFLQILEERWIAREPVCFRGFGIFGTRPTSRRPARNPRTMEDVMIPAGYRPEFRPSKGLRRRISRAAGGEE